MKKIKLISVVGARPNFMKIAPFIKAIKEFNLNNKKMKINHLLIHTGQHYDKNMSEKFFLELKIPYPDINLGVGSGTHAQQVGLTMIELEKVLLKEKPEWVIVVGDVNATMASSITAKKLNINVCHIESGLRSYDLTMPEEINRIVTDHISDLLLTPDEISFDNLLKEGISESKIRFVGNIMIDTLEANKHDAEKLNVKDIIEKNRIENQNFNFNLSESFSVITLHRPSNVDNIEILKKIIMFFSYEISKEIKVLWILHPRTEKQLKKYNLYSELFLNPNIILLNPISYKELLKLNMSAKIIFTDSGGLQEECTVLGTPCITLRENTERPVTLKNLGGVSVLVGNNINKLRNEFIKMKNYNRKPIKPKLWDGKTAQRCLREIVNFTINY